MERKGKKREEIGRNKKKLGETGRARKKPEKMI